MGKNNLYPYEDSEDDFIDMEVGTYINFFDQSQGSPPSPREFEFQMSSNSLSNKDMTTTSPADELFYQGKLLPLHLPPRLQMVENILLQTTTTSYDYNTTRDDDAFEADFFNTPLVTAVNTPTTTSTPFESCNVSPSESFRRMSRELNQEEEYMVCEYADHGMLSDFVAENTTKSKPKKTATYSLLALKLKASKAFLKSLFSKSGCTRDSSAAAFRNTTITTQEGSVKKAKDTTPSNNALYKKVAKKTSFGQIQKENNNNNYIRQTSADVVIDSFGDKEDADGHRRSFSGVTKHRLTTKSISFSSTSSTSSSSSSSSSSDSIGFQELPCFKTSGSSAGSSSDIEISIKGAIAHCKQSQKTSHSGTALTELQEGSFSSA